MKRINDQRIEIFLSYLLRWGVTLSATVVAVSGFLFLLYHAGDTPHFHTFRGEHTDLTSLQGILHAMLQGNIKAFIQFGIVLLIATPVARGILFYYWIYPRKGCTLYCAYADSAGDFDDWYFLRFRGIKEIPGLRLRG